MKIEFDLSAVTIKAEEEVREALEKEHREEVKRKLNAWIPEAYRQKTLQNFIAGNETEMALISQVKALTEEIKKGGFKTLVLLGDNGIGKTHLACGIAHEIIESGIKSVQGYEVPMSAYYTTIDKVREDYEEARSFTSRKTQSKVIKDLVDFDFLILDEIGRVKNDSESGLIFRLIDELYQVRRSSVLVSNLNFTEFAQLVGRATMDRLKDSGVFLNLEGISSKRGTLLSGDSVRG